MNEKITAGHQQRKAVRYIRQSSLHPVAHHQESRRLQYAMKERRGQLGWSEIEVVDEDLGRSASGSVVRAGFEPMVAEVSLDRVGAVAASLRSLRFRATCIIQRLSGFSVHPAK
jgi:hypothetical protein